MAESENGELAEKIAALEARVEKQEKQIALLLSKTKKPAGTPSPRAYRDSFDALDYPER